MKYTHQSTISAVSEKEMLKSMATAFRHGLPFSFNPVDMAELLDTIAETMYPGDDTKLN